MECLLAIGTGIVGKIAEYTVEPVIRQVGYIICYNRNLKKLESQVGDLGDARLRVWHAVETEKRKGREIETDVDNWLTKVEEITGEANDFLKAEHQAKIKCLHGFCPNLKLRHQLSRKSTKLVQEVVELFGKKDFASIAYDVSPGEVCAISTKDYEAFDSRTSVVEQIMDELRNSDTDIIGVYGIGGVGKTTLVKEVYRQAVKDKKLFDDVVIIVDVKQISDLEGIQKKIVDKLGMDIVGDESMDRRARRLCDRLKDKRALIILDDVVERIDLEVVGLPRLVTCKILLTSRSRQVLSVEMHTQKEFQLHVLDGKETWSLFAKMAGDVVKNPNIRTVATEVAEKCGGLPVLVVTVASALKKSGLNAWKDALRRLQKFDKEGFTEKAYLALEWSYNQLDEEKLKSLFLLCGLLLGYTDSVPFDDLLIYGMGLGLFGSLETIEEARNALHSLLEKLKDSCLLVDSDDIKYTRMHDLVRDVANRIASRDHHVLSLAHGNELKEWPSKEFLKKCTAISSPYCNIPKFPDVLECPELKIFYLLGGDHDTLEIPCNLFQDMENLKVLDLTKLCIGPSLPPSLRFLRNLQTLGFYNCILGDIAQVGQLGNLEFLTFHGSNVKLLPKEIGQLTRLRLLDLTDCSELEVISPDVISSLKSLEELRIGKNSFYRWEHGVMSTERSNASLQELKHLSQLTSLQIHIPDASILPADLFTNRLERFQVCIGSVWNWDDVDGTLNALKLQLTISNELDPGLQMLLERTEDLYLEGMESSNGNIVHQVGTQVFQQLKHLHISNSAGLAYIISGKVSFPNLTWLAVSELNSSRFLLSSSMARCLAHLKHLQISGCQIMEEIVSIEESKEENTKNLFCQLEDLELKDLPKLTKFCSSLNSSSERMKLEDYTKSSTISEEIEETDSNGILDIVIQQFLFDNKVELPNLKKLSISGLEKLTTIWNGQFSLESSKKLESVKIDSCQSLKNIFPASMAKNLQRLSQLEVRKCGVEEIIANEGEPQTTPTFVFPNVTYVRLRDLPQLRCFYPAMHASTWPALQTLVVVRCYKLEILSEALSSFQGKCESNLSTPIKQTLFSIEKDSFANLEYLNLCSMEIWNGPLPVHFFRKLKSLGVCCPQSKSVVFLDKLLDEGSSSTSISEIDEAVEIGTLPHLKKLDLCLMPNLMHLGEDNSQSAPRPNFPNLEILLLGRCDSLRNLRSSAISFKNLTTLEVRFCNELKYLLTYSVAKGLIQLTKLEVEECARLVSIVGSTEEDESGNNNEITFRRLKHMKLSLLPRLRGFCSGNCIAKFPALETLSVSNRLKLKIFPAHDESLQTTNEKEDTDVDYYEAMLTAEDEINLAITDLIS
ncbi:putative disease resistance protein [Rosa sericea]